MSIIDWVNKHRKVVHEKRQAAIRAGVQCGNPVIGNFDELIDKGQLVNPDKCDPHIRQLAKSFNSIKGGQSPKEKQHNSQTRRQAGPHNC